MSENSATHPAGVPGLRELQVKYEAVLAENEQLYHDLRTEQAQRERYAAAYRRVQDDAQRDQDILRRLYAQIEPTVNTNREPNAHEGGVFFGEGAWNTLRLNSNSNAVASHGSDRIDSLERDCAYLRGKVESLHLALRRYEEGEDAKDPHALPTSVPSPSLPAISELDKRGAPSTPSLNAEDALATERSGRCRAEEQLARCRDTLQRLRDDATQKEFFFHQQLTALQEQNAALLDDLDMWVTGKQRTYLESTFPSKLVEPARQDTSPSSPPVPAGPFVNISESAMPKTSRAEEALQLRQMQQYLKDQEEVLALKDKSIEQLEMRVRELEKRLANAEVPPGRLPTPSASPLSATIPVNNLLQLRREAAAVEAAVERFAIMHLPETYVLSPSTLHMPHNDSTPADTSAEVIVSDLHSTLRYVREALSHESHFSASPMYPHREEESEPRTHPITVVQPATASSPYHSGETLAEAAQQLAYLMRRHVQS
ncbi:hypothetical protein ABB37_01498 [Leptomonas pyrrhocoris]|uniref:Uncharacterized protein n=1 Tax=Leptomonas pyrrhocoris TaxID=157538 RepID=A0A0N0DZB3_LEPPY|nr:hypothetical protein ABB37_01498 [Leptomonas pyrrhocoris]KPA85092.1 hypothetical protein ABB37_01498 [Leptomonas pyrrhocoris]|eukprot:XP_015663531.1 hypothetical protein ABB37_01498 [Leptomonas pyrrhocoris]